MTPRQHAFVRNKLDGMSNRMAVIEAGYSGEGAKQRGTSLMKHPAVRAALQEGGFDLSVSDTKFPAFRRSAGYWLALSPSMPKKEYTNAIEFLSDAMNCEDLPMALRIELASKLLPFQHKKIGQR